MEVEINQKDSSTVGGSVTAMEISQHGPYRK